MTTLAALLVSLVQQEPSVHDLMKALKARVEAARTIRAAYDTESSIAGEVTRGKGLIRIKGADRWTCEVEYSVQREDMESLSLVCDGRRVVNRIGRRLPIQDRKPAEGGVELRKELFTGVSSPLFYPAGSAEPEIGPYTDLGRQSLDGAEVRIVGSSVRFGETVNEEPMKLFVDPGRMILRRIESGGEGYRWSVTFTAFVYDEDIPDSEFSVQSPRALVQARAEQLARSAELFGRFAGRPLRSLDELAARPADLASEVFWPEGGYVLGAVPKDFRLDGAKVVGPDGVSAAVPPTGREVVAAPTERLRKHYTCRVRLHLVAAAVRAFQQTYGELPKKRAVLWERPEWAAVWPGGGWLPGGKAPEDPWGQALRIVSDVNSVRLQIQDPRARLLPAAALTAEERVALEKAAEPRLSPEERKKLAALAADLADDDLETREEAAKRAGDWGKLLVPFLRERMKSDRRPEARAWLETAVEKIPAPPPVWLSELGALVVTVGSGESGTPSANEQAALACLKTLLVAEADFRANDRDGNRINDFWTGDVAGLYCIGSPNKMIELAVAAADAAPLAGGSAFYPSSIDAFAVRGPKQGYLFQAMKVAPEGGDTLRHTSEFGYCTYPAEYGVTGFRTFIVNEYNILHWKDTGGQPVLKWPTDAELKAEWSHVP